MLNPIPDPAVTATEHLRRLLDIARRERWEVQAVCIERVIDDIEASTF
ncbi:MAG: hypothetical protein AAFY17_08795 [Cyanobacteria bacterium J06642_11]